MHRTNHTIALRFAPPHTACLMNGATSAGRRTALTSVTPSMRMKFLNLRITMESQSLKGLVSILTAPNSSTATAAASDIKMNKNSMARPRHDVTVVATKRTRCGPEGGA